MPNTRTLVASDAGMVVVEKGPKSASGRRVLPLPEPATVALRKFKAVQAQEKLLAGSAYEETGYVLVDDLGAPQRTDWLRRQAYGLMETAKMRKVRLYDARHSTLTYLRMIGVPGPPVSAWAGHGDLTMADRVYVHPTIKDLDQARGPLADLLG